jgi:hypothetical protein
VSAFAILADVPSHTSGAGMCHKGHPDGFGLLDFA